MAIRRNARVMECPECGELMLQRSRYVRKTDGAEIAKFRDDNGHEHTMVNGEWKENVFDMTDQRLRKEAEEKGESRYWTGKPCKHGHIAERITRNGGCVECAKGVNERQNEKRKIGPKPAIVQGARVYSMGKLVRG